MVCNNCHYKFKFDPKISPYLSDKQVAKCINQLSGGQHYHFTYDQLLMKLIRAAHSKRWFDNFLLTGIFYRSRMYFVALVVLLYFNPEHAIFNIFLIVAVYLGSIIRRAIIKRKSGASLEDIVDTLVWERTPKTLKESEYSGGIRTRLKRYLAGNPHLKLTDGKQLEETGTAAFNEAISDYAPERILIVEHNDLVDILVLNHFHFENKVLVLGASKYPRHVFNYYKNTIFKFPLTPIFLIHDASMSGYQMKDFLMADPEWRLQGKQVADLGLFHGDIQKLKRPWLLAAKENASFLPAEKVHSSLEFTSIEGKRVPVGSLNSKVMLGLFSAAIYSSLPLLSDELIGKYNEHNDNTGYG